MSPSNVVIKLDGGSHHHQDEFGLAKESARPSCAKAHGIIMCRKQIYESVSQSWVLQVSSENKEKEILGTERAARPTDSATALAMAS